ncbi:Outer envelope pore protein 16 [Medicago truncatula]|uniref:Outer envelope pore protein n=1 Tax=Medicago truncatula TaxID=3880 RepID=I3SSC7_MEDTR|nr:outer envelope pore protein 16, chloroplastic [Medicago truncatula]AFK43169.1 unknown [Medicago truncatula]KEH39437.1 outer envelope pore protein [Medicago truncatula]RHN76079.1 Outer envelope pore protein 16 [Medicago truncatula]
MPWSRISGSVSSPQVDVVIDMGNPFLNLAVDGFLKIGTVAATRALAEDTFHIVRKGSVSSNDFEKTLKKMCKEGAYWGAIGGVYVGTEYGVERIRGTRDWKNAMIGGAVTGALVSAVNNNKKDKIAVDAITGAAIATAAEFINHFT